MMGQAVDLAARGTKDAVRAQFISNNRSAKVIAFAVRCYYCNVPCNTHNRTRPMNTALVLSLFWYPYKAVFTRSPGVWFQRDYTFRQITINTCSRNGQLHFDTRQRRVIDRIIWSEIVFGNFSRIPKFTNTQLSLLHPFLHLITITFLGFSKILNQIKKN
jgi:hypothetical protein